MKKLLTIIISFSILISISCNEDEVRRRREKKTNTPPEKTMRATKSLNRSSSGVNTPSSGNSLRSKSLRRTPNSFDNDSPKTLNSYNNQSSNYISSSNNYKYKYPAAATAWFKSLRQQHLRQVEKSNSPTMMIGFKSPIIQSLYDPTYCPKEIAQEVDKIITVSMTQFVNTFTINPDIIIAIQSDGNLDTMNLFVRYADIQN